MNTPVHININSQVLRECISIATAEVRQLTIVDDTCILLQEIFFQGQQVGIKGVLGEGLDSFLTPTLDPSAPDQTAKVCLDVSVVLEQSQEHLLGEDAVEGKNQTTIQPPIMFDLELLQKQQHVLAGFFFR